MYHPEGVNFKNLDPKGVYGQWGQMGQLRNNAEDKRIDIGLGYN